MIGVEVDRVGVGCRVGGLSVVCGSGVGALRLGERETEGIEEGRGATRFARAERRRPSNLASRSSTSSNSSSDVGFGGSAGGGTDCGDSRVMSGETPGKVSGSRRSGREAARRRSSSGSSKPGNGGSVALRRVAGFRGAPGARLIVGRLGGMMKDCPSRWTPEMRH